MRSNRPIFGSTSVAMPFVAILIVVIWIIVSNAFVFVWGSLEWIIPMFAFMCLIAGLVVGIVGIVRHERHRWLSIFGVAVNSFFILSVACSIEPSPLLGDVYDNAYALIDPRAPSKTVPHKLSITMDGFTATFCKGSPAYAQLFALLRMKRSDEEVSALGERPSIFPCLPCGEVTIPYFGIPFHFKLSRSTTNPNYLWIRLPHRNRGGTAIIPIIDDGRLLRLVQNTGEQQHIH